MLTMESIQVHPHFTFIVEAAFKEISELNMYKTSVN